MPASSAPSARTLVLPPIGLPGDLVVPADAVGLVLFAHGSGSSRHSPRNRHVAQALNRDRVATLLFDLLTEPEADDRRNVFDVALLGARLEAARLGLAAEPDLAGLPLGYFGASTGAAAALIAAAQAGARVSAVVSRGGRPDLARDALPRVTAPTLLIVGAEDEAVIPLNRAALADLRCEKRLVLVPGATHLFEEPGTLERVVALAAAWFLAHFARPAAG